MIIIIVGDAMEQIVRIHIEKLPRVFTWVLQKMQGLVAQAYSR